MPERGDVAALDETDAAVAVGPARKPRPGKFRPPAEPARKRRERMLERPAQPGLGADMVDENDLAVKVRREMEAAFARPNVVAT